MTDVLCGIFLKEKGMEQDKKVKQLDVCKNTHWLKEQSIRRVSPW